MDIPSIQTLIQRSLREKEKKFAVGILVFKKYKEEFFSDLIKKLFKLNCEVIVQDNKGLLKKVLELKYIFFKYRKNISDVFKQIDFSVYFSIL